MYSFTHLSELHAENCGIAILNPGWIHPQRTLDTSVLFLGKKATVTIEEDSETLQVKPDGVRLFTAEHTHDGETSINESALYYWMHFKCKESPPVLDEEEAHAILNKKAVIRTRLHNSLMLPKEFCLPDVKMYQEMFHDLLFEQETPLFTNEKFQTLFRLMMLKLNETVISEHAVNEETTKRHSVIYSTIQAIFENLTDGDFSVKKLADMMQYNPDYLGRLFKSVMCKSIEEYLIDQRIQHAVNQLIEGNDTIQKIAWDCGFNSKRNFIRQFLKRKGVTPSELRLRYRMMHITNR